MTRSLIPLALLLLAPSALAAPQTERQLLAWDLGKPPDAALWQPNAHVRDAAVADGALALRTEGSDPILVLSRPFDIPASPWQIIEIRLWTDRDGPCDIFWTGTSAGKYGGFAPEKHTPFLARGDSAWHTYRITPYWHTEGKIIRLRLDLFDAARFRLGSIRVLEPALGPAAPEPRFVFEKDACGWTGFGDVAPQHESGALTIRAGETDGHAIAPPVAFPAERHPFLSLELAAEHTQRAALLFATRTRPGLQRIPLQLRPGDGFATVNFDLLAHPAWTGEIIALGLSPGATPDARIRLRRLALADRPQGPAHIIPLSLLPDETLPRVGRPFILRARWTNSGGAPAEALECSLAAPDGIEILPAPERDGSRSLAHGEILTPQWKIVARGPFDGEIVARASARNAPPTEIRARITVTPSPDLPAADYVPKPNPARGAHDVGVYYFPGWNDWSRWQPITGFPERRPALGWYREGDPEVADWHIKWAVEHGITFFAYDWYWDRGRRHLEHGLHDGYFKARYRHMLKFCLLWANHNPPKSSSHDDCLAVTRHWIEQYFRRPEYYRIDGKPSVIIFSTGRLSDDLGADKVRPAFDAMRALCREAGLPGLHLVACVSSAASARAAEAQGYDAVSAYNWPGLGMKPGEIYRPFADLIPEYERKWNEILDACHIPMLLPVSGGWDSRPWHGEGKTVRDGRTPALFLQHLRDARRLLEAPRPAGRLLPAILVEAWNEWGEGSYIEPHQEFGFGYLDAIREAFVPDAPPHTDLTPQDVGRGPYDLAPPPADVARWEFDSDEGWSRTMHLADTRVAGGVLSARSTGADPAFWSPPILATARNFKAIALRMRLAPRDGKPSDEEGRVYWKIDRSPERDPASAAFPARADGQWREHALPVDQNPHWRRTITALRVDPCNRPNVDVEIDWLRLVPADPRKPARP